MNDFVLPPADADADKAKGKPDDPEAPQPSLFSGLSPHETSPDPVPAPAVPPVPAKPELNDADKDKAKAAYETLKAHLDEADPEHPRTGIAGILPAWLALLLKLFGPQFLALIESELSITSAPVPVVAPAPAPASAPASAPAP